jgi:hypothetical protein
MPQDRRDRADLLPPAQGVRGPAAKPWSRPWTQVSLAASEGTAETSASARIETAQTRDSSAIRGPRKRLDRTGECGVDDRQQTLRESIHSFRYAQIEKVQARSHGVRLAAKPGSASRATGVTPSDKRVGSVWVLSSAPLASVRHRRLSSRLSRCFSDFARRCRRRGRRFESRWGRQYLTPVREPGSTPL